MNEVTLYFVGSTVIDVGDGMPFDSYESANDYRLDQENKGELNVYSVTARIDWSTLEKV